MDLSPVLRLLYLSAPSVYMRVGLRLLRVGLRFLRVGLWLSRIGFMEMRVGLWLVRIGLGFSGESLMSHPVRERLSAVLAEPAAEEGDRHLLGGKIQCGGQPQDGGGHGPGPALLDPVQPIGIQACGLGDRAACDAALQPEQLGRELGATCDIGLRVYLWRCHDVKIKRLRRPVKSLRGPNANTCRLLGQMC